ncbi:PPC domain-containing protein [Calothrix sp. UHCC 0171]|uniref:PPC domain-containing protein n=1 Tax=Calothrix sp. UHCC 0171 TaxID=3110245 RepID=UPI002B206BB1|nr:PPC domain-containing protein [Calothrix sp. UHCC 0171]MEA5570652.1 PPC domain-containing protein [Calothrix sp. UHCC 0171]
MKFMLKKILNQSIITSIILITSEINVQAVTPNKTYNPIPLTLGKEIKDQLSKSDIPTGEGGFARDYIVNLTADDLIEIEVKSETFDTIVALLSPKGITIEQNDDVGEGVTNSLIFARIPKTGNYTIRVRSFGNESVEGNFTLRMTRLRREQ